MITIIIVIIWGVFTTTAMIIALIFARYWKKKYEEIMEIYKSYFYGKAKKKQKNKIISKGGLS